MRDLAQLFLWEGAAENVRGDIAFAQSIVETGYFGYVGSIVKASNWNFAGMGACDSCNSGRQFPSPQIGVRVQIQDLRNYADTDSRASNLRNPPVPEWYAYPSLNPSTARATTSTTSSGRATRPTWNQMGNGNHATSPIYASDGHRRVPEHAHVQRPARGGRGRRGPGRQPRDPAAAPERRAHQGLDASTRRRRGRPRSTCT